MRHRLIVLATLLLGVSLAGCQPMAERAPSAAGNRGERPTVDPLPVQQARAYPETATGRFVSLADFEDAPGSIAGFRQVEQFSVAPGAPAADRRFVVNITRTGAAALAVTLKAGGRLVFDIPHVHDFTGYSLVSLALHSETLRDDLRVTLATDRAGWTSHRTLVRPGWNTVLIDIRRLGEAESFDVADVRKLSLAFDGADGPVTFHLDDIMIVDNRREIRPVPRSIRLLKNGLNYSLTLPHYDRAIPLAVGADGLWRLGGRQACVQLADPGAAPAGDREQLELMGTRRLGAVELLEHNPVRLRLANTWYFPTRVGEWASLAVRQIRWEYTFYADGRWVTHVRLNHPGGRPIGTVRIRLPQEVAWAGRGQARELLVRRFTGTVGQWSYLLAPPGMRRETMHRNYVSPGTIRPTLAVAGEPAPGDGDWFDETQGCYSLRARGGNCRFTIIPPPGGLLDPLFRVAGRWTGSVSVNSEGLPIREVVRLDDGAVLFAVPGLVKRPTAVEVTGKVPLLPDE